MEQDGWFPGIRDGGERGGCDKEGVIHRSLAVTVVKCLDCGAVT